MPFKVLFSGLYCPQTGAELLTRAEAVGADGPFGVV